MRGNIDKAGFPAFSASESRNAGSDCQCCIQTPQGIRDIAGQPVALRIEKSVEAHQPGFPRFEHLSVRPVRISATIKVIATLTTSGWSRPGREPAPKLFVPQTNHLSRKPKTCSLPSGRCGEVATESDQRLPRQVCHSTGNVDGVDLIV